MRLSVELLRPIPMAGFAVTATIDRVGRATGSVDARIVDGDERVIAIARGIAIGPDDLGAVPTPSTTAHRLDDSSPGPFPLAELRHDQVAFTESVDLRYPPGQTSAPGPTTVWMRALPLVEGETPSPFQSICPLADCGNAVSRNAEPGEWGFVNPDLTIVLHRPPVGDWFGMEAVSHWQPSGIGMSDAALFDIRGPVGRAVQTLLVRRSA